MRRLYDSFIYEMYLIRLDFSSFLERVRKGIYNMAEWYDQHVVKHNTIELNKCEKKYLTIQKVLGSEIMLNSSFFGIRGKVDGLLEGEYFD